MSWSMVPLVPWMSVGFPLFQTQISSELPFPRQISPWKHSLAQEIPIIRYGKFLSHRGIPKSPWVSILNLDDLWVPLWLYDLGGSEDPHHEPGLQGCPDVVVEVIFFTLLHLGSRFSAMVRHWEKGAIADTEVWWGSKRGESMSCRGWS